MEVAGRDGGAADRSGGKESFECEKCSLDKAFTRTIFPFVVFLSPRDAYDLREY